MHKANTFENQFYQHFPKSKKKNMYIKINKNSFNFKKSTLSNNVNNLTVCKSSDDICNRVENSDSVT